MLHNAILNHQYYEYLPTIAMINPDSTPVYKVIIIRQHDRVLRPIFVTTNNGLPDPLANLWATDVLAHSGGGKFNTAKSYLEDLRFFYEWADKNNIQVYQRLSSLAGFNRMEVKNLTHALKMRRSGIGLVTPGTCNRRIEAIQCFCNFHMLRYIDRAINNDKRYFRGTKQHERLNKLFNKYKFSVVDVENETKTTQSLTLEQIKLVSDAIHPEYEHNPFRGSAIKARNYCMFHITIEAWLRRSELVLLETDDIEFSSTPTITIKNPSIVQKTKRKDGASLKTRGRIVPISLPLSYLVNNYIEIYRPQLLKSNTPSKALFLNERDGQRLSTGSYSRIIKSILTLTPSLQPYIKNLHPHMLRATGATMFRKTISSHPISNSDILNHGELQDMMKYIGGWGTKSTMPQKYSQAALHERILNTKKKGTLE